MHNAPANGRGVVLFSFLVMLHKPSTDITHYLVEFMKFVCGFALILGVSLTLMYFTSVGDTTALSSLLPIA